MTIYPSTTAFLLAIAPYVSDQGQLVQWQDQGLQLYGLQAKEDLSDILAIRLQTLLNNLGVALYTANTMQRKAVDNWMRMVTLAVSEPAGVYYYDLLVAQASSRTAFEGDSTLGATLARNRALGASLAGESAIYADITVTP